MRARSHELLDIDACPILVPALRNSAPGIARALHAAVGDSDIGFTATLTGLDVTVRNERKLTPRKLVPMAQSLKLARLSLNGELVLQSQPPSVRMGKALVELPGGSFLQATEAAEETLAGLVVAGLKAGPRASPTCSAASARSRSGLPSMPECSPPTATSRRSRRCRRRCASPRG